MLWLRSSFRSLLFLFFLAIIFSLTVPLKFWMLVYFGLVMFSWDYRQWQLNIFWCLVNSLFSYHLTLFSRGRLFFFFFPWVHCIVLTVMFICSLSHRWLVPWNPLQVFAVFMIVIVNNFVSSEHLVTSLFTSSSRSFMLSSRYSSRTPCGIPLLNLYIC